jgi:hypothetical protein
MRKLNYLFVLALAVIITSCATKIPYTTAVQEKYKLGESEVKSLQFYLAGDITIYNGNRDGSTGTEGGKLVIKDEQNMNKAYIANGSPGVIEGVEGDVLKVSFEEGKTINFTASKTDGKYRMTPDKFGANNRGEINYGGEIFYVSSTSLRSYLVFKLERSTKQRSTQKVIKGRKL